MAKEKPNQDDPEFDEAGIESESGINDTTEPSPLDKTIIRDSMESFDETDNVEDDPGKTLAFENGDKTVDFDVDQSSSGSKPSNETRDDIDPNQQTQEYNDSIDEDLELGIDLGSTFVPEGTVDENMELGSSIEEDFELGSDSDEDFDFGSDIEVDVEESDDDDFAFDVASQPETPSSDKPVLPKTMVVDDGTLLSNDFDKSVDRSHELNALGISNDGWGKQNSDISNMSSIESPVRAKRPIVQPKLNDRLVVADGERKIEGNPDYRVISFLGAGAMGEVYIARQTSVDRDVAFKKQIPKKHTSRRKMIRDRNKFLFEAQVTANLDHPNIVAIHDMGRDQSGDIFYCMELVRGKPWEDAIADMTLEENLEVLLKVVDGVAYAHSKNTIHRDLKPENTMLGSFGEVLIMDWGLGVNLDNGPPQSMGGTPAFMAPEMAQRSVEFVGKHSDIYLLGAMLFLIVTGEAPHTGTDAWNCLDNARQNVIVDVSNSDRKIDKRLLGIALKAMSTLPEDRHANPEQIRKAIENYQSNLLSIRLAERSEKELASAIENRDYEYFSKSMFGFQEALSLWRNNAVAESGLQRSKMAYAECALERQDFELGMSLLDANAPDESALFQKLRKGSDGSRQRKRLVWIAVGASVLLLTALVVTSSMNARRQRLNAENLAVAVKLENKAKLEAVSATLKAEEAKIHAEEERGKAEAERQNALESQRKAEKLAIAEEAERRRAEGLAVKEKEARETAEQLAVKEKVARKKADESRLKEIEARQTAERLTEEKETERLKAITLAGQLQISEKSARERLFQSNIGLIDGFIRDNQIEQAIETLKRTRQNDSRFVNWEWNRLYHLCHTEVKSESLEGVTAIDQSDNGLLSIVSSLGKARIWNPGSIEGASEFTVANAKAISTALSRNGKWAAIGTADPNLKLTLWDTSSGNMIANLSEDISASLVSCVAFNDSGTQLAVGDSTRVITLFDGNGASWNASRKLSFHSRRPVDLDFNADGQRLISVSNAGLSIVWDTNTGKPLSAYSHPSQLRAGKFVPGRKGLVACATGDREIVFWNSSISNSPATWQELPPEQLKAAESKGYVDSMAAHDSVVNDLDFSKDGRTMMTCGDDRTIAVWNVKDRTLTRRFRGHVNAVLACCLTNEGNAAVSASADGEIRVWRFDEYEDQRTFSTEKSLPLNCVQFNGNATQLLSGGEDGSIRIWNCEKKTQLDSKLEFDPKLGRKATYLPESGRIVTSSPGNVFVWLNGRLLQKHSEVGNSGIVVSSKSEQMMITGGDENHPTIVWDLETGEKIATLLEGNSRNRVTAMAISPDDRYLALGTGLVEGIVSVFDLQSFELVGEFEEHRGWITDLVFSPSSNEFLSADSVEGYVNSWIVEGNQVRRQKKIKGIGGSYIRIAYSDSGTQFVTSTNTDTNQSEMQIWDSETKTPTTKVQLARSIDFVSMIRDEVVFRLTNGKAYGWKHASGQRRMRHVPLYSNASYPTALNGWSKISGDKSLVYGDGFVRIVDGQEQTSRRRDSAANVYDSAGNPGPCVSALFADEERQIAALYQDGAVRLWDRSTNAVNHVIQSPASTVTAIDVSPNDSRRLVVCDSEGTIRCIDVQSHAVQIEVETDSNLNSIKWLDSDSVVVSGEDGISVVNLNTKELTGITNAPKSISGIDRSGAGTVMVGVGKNSQNESRVYLWQQSDGQWQQRPTIFGSQVLSVRVSPDGKRVFSGDASGAITIWYIPEPDSSDPPRKLISLLGHEREVSSIAISTDGRHVASSSKDGSAILWLSAEESE